MTIFNIYDSLLECQRVYLLGETTKIFSLVFLRHGVECFVVRPLWDKAGNINPLFTTVLQLMRLAAQPQKTYLFQAGFYLKLLYL